MTEETHKVKCVEKNGLKCVERMDEDWREEKALEEEDGGKIVLESG